ncbi:hypothetical protein [Pseudomonas tremae]|uniref:hypothetical protein n=1 Tax=Pseudomonas tremae TaxID=200454 RepID=UPI0035323129
MSKYVFKLLMAITAFTSFSAFAAKPPALELYKTNPELIGFYAGQVQGQEITFSVLPQGVGLGLYSITAYNIENNGSEYKLQYTVAGKSPDPVDENGECSGKRNTEYKGYCFKTVTLKVISNDKLTIQSIDEEPVTFIKTSAQS